MALWVNEYLRLKGEERLTVIKLAKSCPLVMDEHEKAGRMSSITDQELEEQIKIHLPKYYNTLRKH